jgi:DNA helicase-2/ATP-dependent DNA helicase PcrA
MTSSSATARAVPTADEVLARLDPEQRAVATALHGPVCVLAGAGTGKTRAITHRIAYGVHAGVLSPQHVLAVTFTARAAGEMRGRLRELGVVGVQARTFHSAALRQLTYFWPRVVGGAVPQLVASKARLIAEAAGRARVPAAGAVLRDLAGEVEWAKSTRVAPDDYVAASLRAGRSGVGDLTAAETAHLYAAYEEVKRARGQIDFEDVLLLTVATLEDRADIAEQVRAQYRHLVVDEYQDVNPLQQALLDQWLGGREDLCVVGDAAQTIYSFTGASPEYLLGFRHRYPDAEVIRLVRDYRSTPQVVALANGVLRSSRTSRSDRVSAAGVELIAQRLSGPQPTFTGYPDETAEAAGVAARVGELLGRGTPASEIAVLFRINAQSEAFEEALAEASVPYLLRGAERFFERPEVRESLVLLRGAARAAANGADGADGTDPRAGLADDVRAVLGSAGWSSRPPAGSGAVRERWESLNALVGLAEELAAADPAAGLGEMVAELTERAAAQHVPTVEGVTLASLHAAKGLEWDAVLLVGLVDGTLPISYADTPAAVEEERRLLYVGVTRAREHLHLSWASARSPGGRASRQPSRFLDGLRPAEPAAGAARGGSAGRSGRAARRGPLPTVCAGCGAPLVAAADRTRGRCPDCPPAYDERVFDRLRAWRLERSQRDSVPAYVVFTDATLEAVAARGPSTLAELATINGVGAVKLDRYGAEVLALLRTGDGPADSPGKGVAPGSGSAASLARTRDSRTTRR